MEPNEIRKLLEKYYEGLTSVEEQKHLRQFFQNKDVPDEFLADRELFAYLDKEVSSSPESIGLEDRLSEWVDHQQEKEEKSQRSIVFLKLSSIAASLALLFVGYMVTDHYIKKKQVRDTFSDPQLAYAEVKRTLFYISEQLNRGTQPLSHMSKINEGMNGMSTFSSFGSGLKELELVSKYYDESNSENNNTK